MKHYILDRYHKRRGDAKEFLGGKCNKCGSVEDLQFDHIDPKTKSFPIGTMWSVSEERFWNELKKCQLLCRKCHIKKSILEAGKKIAKGTHGTLSSYRYCRCILCKDAHSKYQKEYYYRNMKENIIITKAKRI